MKTSQKGFATLEGLLILIIVGLIGFVGWYVYQSKNAADKSYSNAATASSAKVATTSKSTYLEIKEWGVRIKLNKNTESLYYYIDPQKPDFAYLSLKIISNIAPNCAADKFSLAAIGRLSQAQQDDATKNPSDTNQAGTIKIGSFYYSYGHSQADCTDGTASMQARIDKSQPNVNLADSFQTLEAASTSN